MLRLAVCGTRLRPPRHYELWVTDGTTPGTRKVADDIVNPYIHHGRFYFRRTTAAAGAEPWVYAPGALAHSFGHGCGVGVRAPTMHSTTPRLGQPWRLRGTLAKRGSAGAVVIGAVADPPVALSDTCVSYVDAASFAVLTIVPNAHPTWSWTLTIPNVPALSGITLAAQAWFAPSPNPLGFELSNAVYLTFGI